MRAVRQALGVVLVLLCCVGCDQATKAAARAHLAAGAVHSFLGDTFRLELAQNPGAFLSLGARLPPALRYEGFTIAVGGLVAALLVWALGARQLHWRTRLALALIGAGGLGNLIDRIRFAGVVTDFLNLGVGPLRTGIFNVADAVLMAGLIGLLVGWSRGHED